METQRKSRPAEALPNRRSRARNALPPACLLAAALLFCACGAPAAAPEETASPAPAATPTPAPAPTPEPTPEPIREAVLTGESPEEVLALMELDSLEYVDATACPYYDELLRLHEALPDCVIDYFVDVGGVTVRSTDTAATLDGAGIGAEELAEKLALLPWLEQLDICGLGYSNDESLSIKEQYPDLDLIWMVHFGLGRWAVRSDITIFSTLRGYSGYRYTDADMAPLFNYCTDLVALDVGHNAIRDLEPIGRLTKLKVLILGDNPYIQDITPLGNLENLEYIELFMNNNVSDFSCAANWTRMVDLNISFYPKLDNVDFLANMPDLKLGWFINSRVPAAEREAAIEAHPDAELRFTSTHYSSTADGWRATDRNIAIRTAFSNWWNVEDFRAWDDVDFKEGATITQAVASYA